MEKIFPVLTTATIFMFLNVSAVPLPENLVTDAQRILLPQFVSLPRENIQPINDQFSMMVQLTPHIENQAMRDAGYYQVFDWQLATSNPSSLCPSQNYAFQLEGGTMSSLAWAPGEGMLTGKLKTNTGDTTKIRDLTASWAAVEERIEGGQMVQVIEGTLTLGTDRLDAENRYQINGTLTPYGQDLILAIQGQAER